nr:nucleotidyltransferase domain-containing protein [Candidatus Njordarchaeota archaeon]
MKEIGTSDSMIVRFKSEILPQIKKKLNPLLVVIFGSRVRGDSSEESDIDVLLVSDFFIGRPFLGRMPMMLRMFRFAWPIDYLCYTSKEFEKIKSSSIIVQEALNRGVEVVSPVLSN